MKTDLQKFVISTALMNDDLFGKNGAKHELGENKTDFIVSVAKIIGMFSMFFIPTLAVWIIIATLSILIFGGVGMGAYLLGFFGTVIVGLFSLLMNTTIFFEGDTENGEKIPSPYEKEKQRVAQLWQRRRELLRFIHVESELYEHSQAREIAPLLIARVRKHNKMIEEGSRLIALQETLDRNSRSKLAPRLAESITEKVKAEHQDLKNRMETYEVMREMRADMSLDITAALMDIEDLNKSDLDQFLSEKQEALQLLAGGKNESDEQSVG